MYDLDTFYKYSYVVDRSIEWKNMDLYIFGMIKNINVII